MNGKFEDKVAQFAFGDLSPEEGAQFEREVQGDPDAQRALSLYKEMREGLRSLADVPEDQFSKERLRDAILKQGLKPVATQPVSNRGWFWMPVAACALGFGMMFVVNTLRRPSAGPQVVINAKDPAFNIGSQSPLKVAEVAPHEDFKFDPLTVPKPLVRDTAAEKVAARASKNPDEVDPRLSAVIPGGMDEASYDPNVGDPPAGSSQPSATVNTVAVNPVHAGTDSTSSGPIVLIDQDKDEQTGACKATEVGSSSNVLVGG